MALLKYQVLILKTGVRVPLGVIFEASRSAVPFLMSVKDASINNSNRLGQPAR